MVFLNMRRKTDKNIKGKVNAGIKKRSLRRGHVFFKPPTVLEMDGFPFITLDKDAVGAQRDSF